VRAALGDALSRTVDVAGERDLDALLASLRPHCDGLAYVFATTDVIPPTLSPVVVVREAEGITVVVERDAADRERLDYEFVAARITWQVHSGLDAVGLTAAVATALAAEGISANVVAGHFHDHVFVPFDRRSEALAVLRGLAG
jgi:hypothetical protein